MRESEENSEIELMDVSLSSFQLLLHYAYTGRVELNGAKLQVSIIQIVGQGSGYYPDI